MGLYLLAAATARDFGWLGTLDLLDRLEPTLSSMERLPRVQGHFLNWYDTRTLQRLEPQYISTVDSGNLAGHLIALANACIEWRSARTPDATVFAGIGDALTIARESLDALGGANRLSDDAQRQLEGVIDGLRDAVDAARANQGEFDVTFEALAQHAGACVATARAQIGDATDTARGDVMFWLEAAVRTLASHRRDLADLRDNDGLTRRLHMIESKARTMANSMDFAFLLDRERNLLSIGYSVTDGQLDPSCYDLLASEARLASFIAIAKRDIPAKHWFRLGRNVTRVDGGAALISWSGSMFEYLMPSLVMRAPIGSLLENTSRLIVGRQINFATKPACRGASPSLRTTCEICR